MSSNIMRMISFIDGLLRLALFLGTTILLLLFVWQAKQVHGHQEMILDENSNNLTALYFIPPIAICLLGLLGAFYKNPLWLKLYAFSMVCLALGYTIFIIFHDKVVFTSVVSGFIIFHYILAYLAHYLARNIEDQKSHQALMRSYIQYQDELLLPSYPQLSPNYAGNAGNNNNNNNQNPPYYVNPALIPPPSYDSLNGVHHHH